MAKHDQRPPAQVCQMCKYDVCENCIDGKRKRHPSLRETQICKCTRANHKDKLAGHGVVSTYEPDEMNYSGSISFPHLGGATLYEGIDY